jgi:hypothetical protein
MSARASQRFVAPIPPVVWKADKLNGKKGTIISLFWERVSRTSSEWPQQWTADHRCKISGGVGKSCLTGQAANNLPVRGIGI